MTRITEGDLPAGTSIRLGSYQLQYDTVGKTVGGFTTNFLVDTNNPTSSRYQSVIRNFLVDRLPKREHFCPCRQKKVAKSVQRGEPILFAKLKKRATLTSGLLDFYDVRCITASLLVPPLRKLNRVLTVTPLHRRGSFQIRAFVLAPDHNNAGVTSSDLTAIKRGSFRAWSSSKVGYERRAQASSIVIALGE